ncbi:MAG: choice-of-anchor J domain-containing protein [Muribaculaceae bacterium]|nr:choice-of-anchor J domain-containing protein [Muribaculaceae bacterium]
MKSKLFLLGLMAALALPMSAQTATKAEMQARNDRSQVEEIIPFKVVDKAPSFKTVGGKILWDFETNESFAGWLIYDADGDGYNWEVDDYYSCNGGTTSLTSRSYYSGALTPDNWLISPEVPLEGTLTINAMNYSSSWQDVFAVYVYVGGQPAEETDFADFVKISDDITAPDAWTEYTFDMSEYEGRTGCFAIRHYNCTDQYRILVDYISIGVDTPDPTVPDAVTVEPGKTSANVAWLDEDDSMWNLRYRLYDPEAVPGFFEDFEGMGVTGDAVSGGWTAIDANGDGYTWYIWDPVYSGYTSGDGVSLFGDKCATSPSYMGAALTPDNWLITPKVNLTGELSFWACGQDPSYAAEHFAVYVTTGDPEDLDSYVQVSEEFVATSPIQEYTVDLSEYEGQEGYVAIRHFNCIDMFRLNIDNVMIGTPGPEWIYVNDITELSYLIEGLAENTTYEVQVQATDGQKTSDWTESSIFTTTGKVSVDEIVAPVKVDNNYYNLMGQKMNPANLPAGIYIHNGKKVFVK